MGRLDNSNLEKEYNQKQEEQKEKRRQAASCVQKAGTVVSEGLATLFYK